MEKIVEKVQTVPAGTYTVKHLVKNLADENYSVFSEAEADEKIEIAEDATMEKLALKNGGLTAVAMSVSGGDDDKTVTVFYNRNVITYTFNAGEHGAFADETKTAAVSGLYGAAVKRPLLTDDSYYFSGWDKEVPSAFDETDKTFTAVWKEKSVTTEGFVFVPGGTITGKSNTNNYSGVFIEGRTVTLSPFMMCDHEVTQGEWKAVMDDSTLNTEKVSADPSDCKAGVSDYEVEFGKVQENRPVENVTWYDAVYYCNLLSEKERLKNAYTITKLTVSSGHITSAEVTYNKDADGYRLPTEAEWEYAARGGDPTKPDWDYTFSGADKADGTNYDDTANAGMDSVGWYCYNNNTWKASGWSGKAETGSSGSGTHEVKQLKPNALGLYDMSGNVWEWCWDRYSSSVSTGEETDPTGAASGSYRVDRGGSWYDFACYASVCSRYDDTPDDRYDYLGFRVVRSAK